ARGRTRGENDAKLDISGNNVARNRRIGGAQTKKDSRTIAYGCRSRRVGANEVSKNLIGGHDVASGSRHLDAKLTTRKHIAVGGVAEADHVAAGLALEKDAVYAERGFATAVEIETHPAVEDKVVISADDNARIREVVDHEPLDDAAAGTGIELEHKG